MKTIRRVANVSQEEALKEFISAYPDVKTEFPFPKETIDGTEVYVAKVITAEFPPPKDDSDSPDGDDEPKSDSSDSDSSSDSKPKSEKSDSKGGNKEVIDLIHQLAQGLGVPLAGGDDPMADDAGNDMVPPPDNLDLPDVGAPPAGAPLPPPAHPGGGMGAGHSFSSTQLPDRFAAFLEDADDLSLVEAAKEAEKFYAGYQVMGTPEKKLAKFNGREQTIFVAQMQKR